MATAISPKSEARMVRCITIGFGEVPEAEIDGRQGWALPGNRITFDRPTAVKAAEKLDAFFRANPKTKSRLLN